LVWKKPDEEKIRKEFGLPKEEKIRFVPVDA